MENEIYTPAELRSLADRLRRRLNKPFTDTADREQCAYFVKFLEAEARARDARRDFRLVTRAD